MNAFVDTGAQAIATAGLNWTGDTIKAFLADASFTPTYDAKGNINNADFLSDVSTSMVGSAVTLTGKSAPAGVLKADDVVFPAVAGNTVVRVWVYKHTGVAGTSQLILAYDSGDGFPVAPDGSDITLFWDTGVVTTVAGVAQI